MTKTRSLHALISDVKQIHPEFSLCTIDILYKGNNRNGSYLTDESVTRALPTLKNIPIVGEYSEELNDFKGHGGKIDMDSYKYVHTTKPYGVVPESATYEYKDIRDARGVTKTYLTVRDCILWTGRYEEALSIIESENGKGQSMEIIINSGEWDEEKDAYRIDDFTFSALCILGDNVNPAFENSRISGYTLDKTKFNSEFEVMMNKIETNLISNEEGEQKMLKELLEKYSTSVEVLTEKGVKFSELSEDQLEDEIKRVLEVEEEQSQSEDEAVEEEAEEIEAETEQTEESEEEAEQEDEKEIVEPEQEEVVEEQEEEVSEESELVKTLQDEVAQLKLEKEALEGQLTDYEALKQFKLDTELAKKQEDAQVIFNGFQLSKEEVKDIDVATFSLDEIKEKCYAILGRKLASNKEQFSLKDEAETIKLPFGNQKDEKASHPYGDLFSH